MIIAVSAPADGCLARDIDPWRQIADGGGPFLSRERPEVDGSSLGIWGTKLRRRAPPHTAMMLGADRQTNPQLRCGPGSGDDQWF